MTDQSPNYRAVIKTEDGLLAYYFTAQIANRIIAFTHRYLPFVTPNWFTLTSFVLLCVSVVQFGQGDYRHVVWGVIWLHLSFVFDCCDGQLARIMGMKRQVGAWFDYHSDKIKDGLLLFALAWGVQTTTNNHWIVGVAFFGIFFHFLRKITTLYRDSLLLEIKGKRDQERTVITTTKDSSQLKRALKHSVLFKVADRIILFTICALLNWVVGAVVIYTLIAIVFAIASAWINYKTLTKLDGLSPNLYGLMLAIMVCGVAISLWLVVNG